MVKDFHRKFGLLPEPGRPELCSEEVFRFRHEFMQEELAEMWDAYRDKDMVKFADSIADLLYVAYGTAVLCRIPIDAVFEEVHRANMRKVRANGDDDPRGTRGSKFDVVKPEGWTPPDVVKVLRGNEEP
jgi:predicted HAD superfamily Cof-like phosphohydrolase